MNVQHVGIYDCLEDEGFQHLAVNHTYHFKDPQTGAHMNTIEGTWGAIKSATRKHYDKQNFAFYLAEHVWWKNSQKKSFNDFVESIKKVYPPYTQDSEEN
ncbi:hypothetical protein X975_07427, partial [Stegodyphus mimosarum]